MQWTQMMEAGGANFSRTGLRLAAVVACSSSSLPCVAIEERSERQTHLASTVDIRVHGEYLLDCISNHYAMRVAFEILLDVAGEAGSEVFCSARAVAS
jgi:hypothetical protein